MSAYYNGDNDAANLPSKQHATASSYDPAAYIMVAKPESFSSIQSEWQASFRRATALNKITLNIPSGIPIDKVVITAPHGKYLAGQRSIDLSTGESGTIYGGTESIEVNYATPLTGSNVDVWFTSWDVEIAAGETLTITVHTTDNNSYTKTITVPSDSSIKFKEGCLNTLKANMARYEKVTSNLSDWSGEYLIVCESESIAFDASCNYGSWNDYIDVTISNDYIVSNTTTDRAMFTIETMEGGYSIKGTSGMYVGIPIGGSGGICQTADRYLNTISINNGNAVISADAKDHDEHVFNCTLRYEDDKSTPDKFCYRLDSGGEPVQLYKKTMISNN